MNSGMGEFQNRTLICSVLFIDIVEYSRKPVVEQSRLKDHFNALLSQALRGVAVNDRIILDTGDGAAISFIGDPEDALFVATGLRDVIAGVAEPAGPELATRMGINLGPVRLVKDINGQPNVIGDGINVAQRVMTFAKPGQVLVSRSYYEVVSRLSEESSRLFSYEGARTDKHIREHEVYAVGAIPGVRRRLEDNVATKAGKNVDTAGYARLATKVRDGTSELLRRPRLVTVAAVISILSIALAARAYLAGDETIGVPATEVAAAVPAPVPDAIPAPPQPPIKGLPPEPVAVPAEAQPLAEAPPAGKEPDRRTAAKAREKPAPRAQVAQSEPPPAPPAPVYTSPPAPAAVSFAIAPWGEVHVDGRMQGVTPPLQELELTPGRHRIEIRNGGFAPHVVTVNAKPGQRLRIKHKFN
jgi:class 3 adenylate cyclase